EARLCGLALTATASQLARMVSGYRGASGSRIGQEELRGFRWSERDSGVVDVRIRLPKEEAAVVLAAVQAAKDQHGTPPPPADSGEQTTDTEGAAEDSDRVDATPTYALVDAVLDLARDYLAMAPADRSGEDRTMVVVQVAADHLAASPTPATPAAASPTPASPAADRPASAGSGRGGDVPAGTFFDPLDDPGSAATDDEAEEPSTRAEEPIHGPENVPAGTFAGSSDGAGSLAAPEPTSPEPVCQVQGVGGIEPETARKLACDNDLLGAVVDAHGDVLALGRNRRLVSRAQRRALMIRDHGMCQYPACHQTRYLKAHHIRHWVDGGPTDLDNLVLVCQFHHTAVHEGRMTIIPTAAVDDTDTAIAGRPGRRYEFRMPDTTEPRPWWDAHGLTAHLTRHGGETTEQQADLAARIAAVDDWDHPDAARIRPGWAGEPFDLHACVEALFGIELPDKDTHQLAA
ncbi:MAG: HNH endonuclease, partial [Propionibacteriaceae bacterium]